MTRLIRTALVVFTMVLACVACSEEVIVLATVRRGSFDHNAERCVTTSECPAGSFCDHRRCDQLGGTCQRFPVSCTDDERPVCGCDGVTYFNDCLRRAA